MAISNEDDSQSENNRKQARKQFGIIMLRSFAKKFGVDTTTNTKHTTTGDEAKVDKNQPKRRALGDITNSTNVTNAADAAKDAISFKKSTLFSLETAKNNDETASTSSVDNERSYMQRPADDIDARDIGNPLLCTQYVNEMYDHYNEVERQFMVKDYISKQQHVNERMRTILVDWLVEVHLKFKMVPETLYLSVNLIDRYLEKKQVRRSKLQLVGVAALSLAAKYEEIYPPELRELVYITDKAYNKAEVVEMESDIVNTLEYNLTVPTIHTFLCRYLKAAHADRTMVQLACYIAERTLQEYSMVKYLPSVIAATSVLIARKSLKRNPWSPTLVNYTKYDECDLVACNNDIGSFINDETIQQQAVAKKYSSPKFGSVAKMTALL